MKAAVVLPGAATHIVALVEVVDRLLELGIDPVAIGGASAGGMVALAYAAAKTPSEVRRMVEGPLRRGTMVDVDLLGIATGRTFGLARGKGMRKELERAFGDMRLRDLHLPARVTVSDTWQRCPAVIDSKRHGDLFVSRVAQATGSVQLLYHPVQLRDDNARTYADGGAGLNVPAGLWDDRPEPTIVVRFRGQAEPYDLNSLIVAGDSEPNEAYPRRVASIADAAKAGLDVMLDSACAAWPSRKAPELVENIVIDSPGDGFDFTLDEKQIAARRVAGRAAVDRWWRSR